MAAKLREKDGFYWVVVHHQGRRKWKKLGTDKRQAMKVVHKVNAQLALGEFSMGPDEGSRTMEQILERHAALGTVRESPIWNQRERAPYPDDYDLTVARHAAWQVEQFNATVGAKLDEAQEEVTRLTSRVSSDWYYLSGFVKGVEEARTRHLSGGSESSSTFQYR